MTTRQIDLTGLTPFQREHVVRLVNVANGYVSHILLEHRNRTINGKSMLGLLSLGDVQNESVTLIVDGDDEKEALEAVADALLCKA